MTIVEWRPLVRGTLRGFVSVELEVGLIIESIKVFDPPNSAFIQIPDRPAVENGQLKRDQGGNVVYYPAVKWRDRKTGDKFSSAVLRLLRAKHPDALTGNTAGNGAHA
jgi:hypothetical protein